MFSWLFSEPLQPGEDAPDFTLPDQDGKAVSLSELRGTNVVLVFYPIDETPTCRANSYASFEISGRSRYRKTRWCWA